MNDSKLPTQFAPAERADEEQLKKQKEEILKIQFIKDLLDFSPDLIVILNDERQIVYANQGLIDFINAESFGGLFGYRPGEVLKCIHSDETPGGCGTTEYCSMCGATRAILNCRSLKQDTQECHILRKDGSALDLRVWTRYFTVNGINFTLMAMADISHEKRRRALERIFFHDILNTVGGIQGFSELMKESDPEEMKQYADQLVSLSESLMNDIRGQQDLLSAENGELSVCPEPLNPLEIINSVYDLYKNHKVSRNKLILIAPESESFDLIADGSILQRILGNLVKNALEAEKPGAAITIACENKGGKAIFRVHNDTPMPRDVQLQIFQRDFSTKGSGRGLGTYGAKLLTEKYLKGRIRFISSPDTGTDFILELPPPV